MSLPPPTKESVMLRDTSGQDRVIERRSFVKRNFKLLLGFGGAGVAALLLLLYLMHYAGAGNSVDRFTSRTTSVDL